MDNPFIDLLKTAKEMMPDSSDHTVSINMGEDFLKVRLYWFNGTSYENTSIQLSLVELSEDKFDLLQHANIMVQRKLEDHLMERELEQGKLQAGKS